MIYETPSVNWILCIGEVRKLRLPKGEGIYLFFEFTIVFRYPVLPRIGGGGSRRRVRGNVL